MTSSDTNSSGMMGGRVALDLEREHYIFTNGWTMEREGKSFLWSLRTDTGELIDQDQYRHDIMPRHGLTIQHHNDLLTIARSRASKADRSIP